MCIEVITVITLQETREVIVTVYYLCSCRWQLSIHWKSDLCLPWQSPATTHTQTPSPCNDMPPQRQLRGHPMQIFQRKFTAVYHMY